MNLCSKLKNSMEWHGLEDKSIETRALLFTLVPFGCETKWALLGQGTIWDNQIYYNCSRSNAKYSILQASGAVKMT